MEGIYFGFALFIFALICALIFIWRRVYLSMKAPDRFEREVNWAKRYQDLQNMVDGFEAYVDEVQEDIRREKAELRQMMQRTEEIYRKLSGGEDIDAPVIVTLGDHMALSGYGGARNNRRRRAGEFPEIAYDERAEAPDEQPPFYGISEKREAEEEIPHMADTEEQMPPLEEMLSREEIEELAAVSVDREETAPELPEEAPPDAELSASEMSAAEEHRAESKRREDVIWMHRMGFSDIRIAQQLAITRNEVKLILELWESGGN